MADIRVYAIQTMRGIGRGIRAIGQQGLARAKPQVAVECHGNDDCVPRSDNRVGYSIGDAERRATHRLQTTERGAERDRMELEAN
jgi:hypothetical protein